MKTLITIQHTQSVHHANGMIGGWTDWELTERGTQQAKNIGEALREEIRDQHYVMFASDLLRARQTADIIAPFLNIVPKYRKELRELHMGSATGKSVKWLQENQARPESRERVVDFRCLEDAESKRDLYTRLLLFLQEMQSSDEKNIIIVSHGGTLNMLFFLWHHDNIDDLERTAFHGMSGGVSVLKENNDGLRIIQKINDMSYMSSHSR
ncbi:MAG: phosphoglycerate mutase family protein [Methanoregula sp.]|nr:phosphoglycerate mutase family protein [Methanoregula sp.]